LRRHLAHSPHNTD